MASTLQPEAISDLAALADEVAGLFAAHRASLLRYLISLGVSPEEGEEVVQEAFLALFIHLREGKPRENLRGWIFRVAHNLGLREQIRSVRRPQVELDERLPASSPTPEQQAAQAERHRRLFSIVRALPAEEQHCLHLRAEGLSYREIGHVLGISLGSVAMILSRALLKFTKAEVV